MSKDKDFFVTRTWLRDGSTNFLTLGNAVRHLELHGLIPDARWYDRRELARAKLLAGGTVFTKLASFRLYEGHLIKPGASRHAPNDRRTLTTVEAAEVEAGFQAGLTASDIARRLGRDPASIRYWASHRDRLAARVRSNDQEHEQSTEGLTKSRSTPPVAPHRG